MWIDRTYRVRDGAHVMSREHRQVGFASLEILAATTVVAVMILSIATMYLTAHTNVERSGDTTVAVALAGQMIEDMRSMPFSALSTLNGFDTNDPSTLPADDPQRTLARRWRYAVAGEASGWSFNAGELSSWTTYATLGDGVRGNIQVTSPSTSMRAVSVTIAVPNQPRDLKFATLISRIQP